jgi:hypothetical protein
MFVFGADLTGSYNIISSKMMSNPLQNQSKFEVISACVLKLAALTLPPLLLNQYYNLGRAGGKLFMKFKMLKDTRDTEEREYLEKSLRESLRRSKTSLREPLQKSRDR